MTVEQFPETVQVLRSQVDDGMFTRGAQVSVVVDGMAALDLAIGDDGNGMPMRTDTVLRVYCSIKPVTAMAVGHLIDAGAVALDTPLVDVIPGPAGLADGTVQLRHVLNHTAGLHRPHALEIEVVAPDKRSSVADSTARPPGWMAGRRAAYSEWYAWHLLGRLIESLTETDLRTHLRAEVLDPLGLQSTWIGMVPEEYPAVLERMGTNLDMRTNRSYPLILERGERMCTETNPAHGGYTSAAELARFYGAVLACRAGDDVPGLPSPDTVQRFTSPQRPSMDDEVLGRDCTFGYGFMTDLADHFFGRRCPPGTFGHSGNVGSTFAFADPERDVAVAVVFNGVVDAESAFVRRPAMVSAIYRDLESRSAATDVTDAVGDDETGTRPRFSAFRRRRRS